MAKKKKKTRNSVGAEDPAASKNSVTSLSPLDGEPSASLEDLISVQILESSSPPLKSLRYSPLVLLNQVDADRMDVRPGDQVFLLSILRDDDPLSKVEKAAVGRVQIVSSGSVATPISDSKMFSPKTQRSKVKPGICHIFPSYLAREFIGVGASHVAQTPVPQTPVTIPKTPSTPSSSNSKFSFAKGGGGDLMISTPAKKSSSETPNRNPGRSKLGNIWVVPVESSLGDRIGTALCRTACKINISVQDPNENSSNAMKSLPTQLFSQLVLAHTLNCYISTGSMVHISFQGRTMECCVASIEGGGGEQVLEQSLANLNLDASDEEADLLKSLRNAKDDLTLFRINQSTTVTCAFESQESKGTHDEKKNPKIALCGLETTIDDLERLVMAPLLHPDMFRNNMKPPKGLLLHGPSGTGKSSIAKHLAENMRARNIIVEYIHCTSLQSKTSLVGQAEKKLVDLFRSAKRPRKQQAGCLLILDDIHFICPSRQGSNSGADRLTSTLLALLDGLDDFTPSASGEQYPFFVVAVTTNPSILDPALRRPGRLDSEIEIALPDEPATRGKLLQFYLEEYGVPGNLSPEEQITLGRLAKGFTGADLKLALKEYLRLASSTDSILDMNNIKHAIRSIKPSAIKSVSVEIPQVQWDAIGGMSEVKRQLREAIELPLTHGHVFAKLGIRPPRGVLLYGPPGCSKTLMARALATEGHMNFLTVKGPELLSKWLGESERALASLFKRARLASPSIIFFDEVDAVASKRGGSTSGGERLLSQLLTELDGISKTNESLAGTRVVVVCATNRPDLLDRALMRPGRIDRMIYVGLPDNESRLNILKIGLKGKSCSNDIKFDHLAQESVSGGLSGAEIISACRDAALYALEENEACKNDFGPVVMMKHMVQALTTMERQVTAGMVDFYKSFKGEISIHL